MSAALLVVWRLLAALCLFVSVANGYHLRIRVQPGRAAGGTAFEEQPQLELTLADGITLAAAFTGYITAELITGPIGWEREGLWYNVGGVSPSSDPLASQATLTNTRGQAAFQGLYIKRAAANYAIRFVAFDNSGIGVAWVDSKLFTVVPGAAYQIGLQDNVGTMYGGGTFDTAVRVALQDRGGNPLTDVTAGTVTCTLTIKPPAAVLKPTAAVVAPMVHGSAVFTTLSIDLAAVDYQFTFTYNQPLTSGVHSIVSNYFTVGIGPPHHMAFLENPSMVTPAKPLLSGQPLPVQPRVAVYDAGGNMMVNDHESGVLVSIQINSPNAELGPAAKTFQVVDGGVATFSSLEFNKPGRSYVLRFEHYTYSSLKSEWDITGTTGLYIDTAPMDVQPGMPIGLQIAQTIDGGWAGGRGFKRQPLVSLVDGGGSVCSTSSSTLVTALVAPSIAVHSRLIIDTSSDGPLTVTNAAVTANGQPLSNGQYGVGHAFDIDVTFSGPLTVDATAVGAAAPVLLLNAESSSNVQITAVLISSYYIAGAVSAPTDILRFRYTVTAGDVLGATYTWLDHTHTGALSLNSCVLRDLWGHSVNTVMTAVPVAEHVSLSTAAPIVISVTTATPSGAYATGQVIDFNVKFSFPVTVTTLYPPTAPAVHTHEPVLPQLPLNMGAYTEYAVYTSGSGTDTLVFRYTVKSSDTSSPALHTITAGGAVTAIQLPVRVWSTWTASSAILQFSTHPSLAANVGLSLLTTGAGAASTNMGSTALTVGAAPVTVTSVTKVSPNGVYTAGDSIVIAVQFSAPVSVHGDVSLLLSTGGRAVYTSHTAPNILKFTYTVQSGHNTVSLPVAVPLDFTALDSGSNGWFRRTATRLAVPLPIDTSVTPVNIAVAALLPRLSTSAALTVSGDAPTVTAVSLAPATSDFSTHSADGTVALKVSFSKPVTVAGGASPVLNLQVGAVPRAAVYSGPGLLPNELYFSYTVQIGDNTPNVALRSYPEPLCHTASCSSVLVAGVGILEKPLQVGVTGQHADLRTFNSLGTALSGASSVVVDTAVGRQTTAVAAPVTTTASAALVYGYRDVIELTVQFQDEVVLSTPTLPSLLLTNGGTAKLISGTGTRTLLFAYTVPLSAVAANTLNVDTSGGVLHCAAVCNFENRNGVAVNLAVAGGIAAPLKVDVALVPTIVSVSETSGASVINGKYTAGDVITVVVTYSHPVVVQGVPLLKMSTGAYARYREPAAPALPTTVLNFKYTVAIGELAPAGTFTWHSVNALLANTVAAAAVTPAQILRAGSYPTVTASVTLPAPTPLALIALDAMTVPVLQTVTSPDADGVYGPGDVLTVWLTFNRPVSVIGQPMLRLAVANLNRGGSAAALYNAAATAAPATKLVFTYTVQQGDVCHALDVADTHALEFGFYEGLDGKWYEDDLRSVIAAAISPNGSPSLPVSRVLPIAPGDPTSLSVTRAISVSSVTPHIVSVKATTAAGSTTSYSSGAVIDLVMSFSAPITLTLGAPPAVPQLLLETGSIDRWAPLQLALTTATTLTFRYTVVTGDSTSALDYWCDDSDGRYAGDSLNLFGATLKLATADLSADVHLNPPGGLLQGATSSLSTQGTSIYRDLFLRRRGRQYRAWFEAALQPYNTPAQVYTDFDVGFSVEFELTANSGDSPSISVLPEANDAFGASLFMDDDLVVAGAPGKHLTIPEVQLIRVLGTGASPVNEVQVVAVEAAALKEVQQFSTYVAVGASAGGSWTISYPGLGTTGDIPAGASPDQVQTILQSDLPALGRVLVQREPYTYCACANAYTWTLTFDEKGGDVQPVVVGIAGLTGGGGSVTPVKTLVNSPVLGGTFELGYNGWAQKLNPAQASTTGPIPYDATAVQLQTIIEATLDITVSSVSVQCCTPQNGRKWLITFGDDHGDYNMAQLTSNTTGLTGTGAYIWHSTGRNGTGPVNGQWRVAYHGSAYTPWLSTSITESDLETELELLDSVRDCTVTRENGAGASQYTWRVTFLAVNAPSRYGFVPVPMGNLPALTVDSSRIRGTGGRVAISHCSGSGADDYAPWEGKHLGSFGAKAGAVFAYSRVEAVPGSGASSWELTGHLVGSDTNEGDAFGTSVSGSGTEGLIVVGAPYSEDLGVQAQQRLICSGGAATGTFTLSFRGFTTGPIAHDVTLSELRRAIIGPFGTTRNLHTLPNIEVAYADPVAEWGLGGTFCSGSATLNTAVLTFLTPAHGMYSYEGALELLTVDNSDLSGAAVSTTQLRTGTVNPSGPNSRGIQKGAAYVYRWDSGVSQWLETQKLVNPAGSGTDRFGWSVAMHTTVGPMPDYIAVGAPGELQEAGSVHVYMYSSSSGGVSQWNLLQTLTSQLHSSGPDQFGSALAVDGDTLVISAVGAAAGSGAVDIWSLSVGGVYQATQRITLPDGQPGDQFGFSVSLYQNLLVIGCPGRSDTWLHTGRVRSATAGHATGAVYVYQRPDAASDFVLFRKLDASNVKPDDRLGHGVAVHAGVIVATSLQKINPSSVRYQRSVQVVEVQAARCCTGNTYRLGWRESCSDSSSDNSSTSSSITHTIDAAAARLTSSNSSSSSSSGCRTVWSEPIQTDATAATVKATLEAAFGLGLTVTDELYVTRSAKDPITDGYAYTIVFVQHESDVPQLLVDYSVMTGPGATVTVTTVNEVPDRLRGVAHVFQRLNPLDTTEPFREQCFLYPFVKQRQDLFGAAVALSGPFVAVGAPNTDTSTGSIANSDLLDVNSGSAVVFALDFLGVRFDAPAYTVTEGDSTALSISRTAADSVQVFFVKSLDRNSLPQFSDYVAAVFDLAISPPDVPLYKTALDIVGAGTATASSQSYGNSSGSSYWSQGVFDYRGLSDYVPMEDQLQFVRGQFTQTYTLHTNDDNVVEIPDETLTVAIYLPSIYPSLLGDLVVTVTITDNSDGEGPNGSVSGNDDWGTVNATVPLPLYQDARVYSTKLSSDSVTPGDRFGAVIDTDENGLYMAVGDEHVVCVVSATSTLQHCGAVYIFKLDLGVWVQVAAITSPVPAAGAAFGAAVQIDGAYGRSSDYTLVVGAPGLARAYIYALTNAVTDAWTLDTVLQPPDDGGLHTGLTADLLYGAVNTLALSDDVLAVAAPGAESLYLHYRTWVSSGSGGAFVWSITPSLILHSADRDEDQLLTHTALHTQGYGAAVALEAAGRTLAVGCPYADYGNLGTSDVDMWDSYPSNGRIRARGRVFVYHRQAPSQTVTLVTKRGNSAGTFMFELVHRDVTAVSAQLQWNANTSVFTAGIESLDNVGRVEVAATAWEDVAADVSYRQWRVTFLGELDADPPLLNPQWYIPPGAVGCTVCTPFNRATANATTPYLSVVASGSNSAWQQEAALQSIDRRAGDQFGETVAIDGESLIVGASLSSAITTTTWDFETGDLSGWSSTGTAFQNQPTLGDNAYYRRVYSAPPQHTGLTGRYYIGSFEDRPGGGTLDYLSPRVGKLAGGTQGDAPMGTLTSEPFAILGDSISLLVGGGCDSAAVYAELTVDGTSVARAAGRCDELLRRVTFDVARYNGRMGRIRIVDASAAKWGHISVDDIRFSWTNRGGALAGVTPRDGRVPTVNPTVNPTVSGASTSSHSCLQEETPQAGAVYVFARLQQQQQLVALSGNSSVAAAAVNYCDSDSDRLACSWTHQTKLVASDKRSGDRFGTAIALNHAAGLIAVGASGSSLTGFWREPATVYTTEDPFGTPFEPHTSAAELPANGRLFEQLRATGAYSSLQQAGSGAPLVWNVTSADATAEARVRGASNAGAVYVYKRAPAEIDCKGVLQRGEAWTQSEHFRLQAHDSGAGDRFGAAIALVPAQRQLLVGAPRAGAFGIDAGALYQLDTAAVRVRFAHSEYSVTEGSWRGLHSYTQALEDWKVPIEVLRDPEYALDWLTVGYATSDLTAKGVDSTAYMNCWSMPAEQRKPEQCGDYEQTAGQLTFKPGQTQAFFYVRLMDDHCWEPFPEYVQLTLSIPGTAALQGESYMAKIRIDDNDQGRPVCRKL